MEDTVLESDFFFVKYGIYFPLLSLCWYNFCLENLMFLSGCSLESKAETNIDISFSFPEEGLKKYYFSAVFSLDSRITLC